MPNDQYNIAETITKLIRNPQPQTRVKLIRHPNHSKGWLILSSTNEQDYFMALEKLMPYITGCCKDWLTDFGKWTVPDHFPTERSVESSSLYDTEEVLDYLNKIIGD